MKQARGRAAHVVAVETEKRLNKSTVGRTEAAEAERGELVCSGELLVRPNRSLSRFCQTCQVLYAPAAPWFPRFASSGSERAVIILYPSKCPILETSSLLHGQPESDKARARAVDTCCQVFVVSTTVDTHCQSADVTFWCICLNPGPSSIQA